MKSKDSFLATCPLTTHEHHDTADEYAQAVIQNNRQPEARETTQMLIASVALAEDSGSVPRTHSDL